MFVKQTLCQQGLVLLAVIQPDGQELKDPEAKSQMAHSLGVLAAPSLQGLEAELQVQLPRLASAHLKQHQQQQGDLSLAKLQVLGPVSYEGWVIEKASARHKVSTKH